MPVNSQQAKRILICYRPGIDDASDPEVQEALRLAEQDLELRAWVENQGAAHAALRACLQEIPVPPELRWKILAQAQAQRKTVAPRWRRREFLAAAAAGVVLLALSAFWYQKSGEEETFAAFRSRMVRFALREYRMDIVTNNASEVRQFLARRGAPADYVLSKGLESRPVIGGASLTWQGHPVAMVCLAGDRKETLYLFVMDRGAVRGGALPGATPAIVSLHRINAASWTLENKIYLLAAPLDETELRGLL